MRCARRSSAHGWARDSIASDNLKALGLTFDDEDRAAIGAATDALTEIPGDCGDEYRKPPFLTASGDLSHHLDALAASLRCGRSAGAGRTDAGR